MVFFLDGFIVVLLWRFLGGLFFLGPWVLFLEGVAVFWLNSSFPRGGTSMDVWDEGVGLEEHCSICYFLVTLPTVDPAVISFCSRFHCFRF